MKQGGNHGGSNGFTIVEVMIVLAVTSAMFVIAVLLVNGRQNKTEFTTSINDAKQQIQQVINETTSGYFPGSTTFSCTGGASVTITAGGAGQGTNSGCVFLGKALQFEPKNAPGTFNTYTIVGLSSATGSVTSALPVLVAPAASPRNTWPTNVVKTTLQNGLTTSSMYYNDNPALTTNGLALVSNIGQVDPTAANGGLSSGTTQLTLVALTTNSGTLTTQTTQTFAQTFDTATNFATNYGYALTDIDICMTSGTTNDSGLITITANSLAVDLKIFTGSTTCGN